MALWGTKDVVYGQNSDGSVAISGSTVTGTGTTFNTANLIKAGDIITVGTAGTCGEGIIKSVDSATQITLINADHIIDGGHTITGQSYEVRQKPISTVGDSNYGANEIFGVDTTEQSVARAANSIYRPAHAGWVGITSYTQTTNGVSVQRVKTEVLVASSSITADDASDDTILPNS